MQEQASKIRSFRDLRTWQAGHVLVLDIYRLTKKFPKEELFCLVMQMRRAVISFTSNIAEGFGRNTFGEKIQFYGMALGSLTELQNQILIARDLQFLSPVEYETIFSQTVEISKND